MAKLLDKRTKEARAYKKYVLRPARRAKEFHDDHKWSLRASAGLGLGLGALAGGVINNIGPERHQFSIGEEKEPAALATAQSWLQKYKRWKKKQLRADFARATALGAGIVGGLAMTITPAEINPYHVQQGPEYHDPYFHKEETMKTKLNENPLVISAIGAKGSDIGTSIKKNVKKATRFVKRKFTREEKEALNLALSLILAEQDQDVAHQIVQEALARNVSELLEAKKQDIASKLLEAWYDTDQPTPVRHAHKELTAAQDNYNKAKNMTPRQKELHVRNRRGRNALVGGAAGAVIGGAVAGPVGAGVGGLAGMAANYRYTKK